MTNKEFVLSLYPNATTYFNHELPYYLGISGYNAKHVLVINRDDNGRVRECLSFPKPTHNKAWANAVKIINNKMIEKFGN
jgi:hypothetical protein